MCNKRYMDPDFSMAFCSIYNIVYVNGKHLCCMYCELVEILRTLCQNMSVNIFCTILFYDIPMVAFHKLNILYH